MSSKEKSPSPTHERSDDRRSAHGLAGDASGVSRRQVVATTLAGVGASSLVGAFAGAQETSSDGRVIQNDRIKQSVCRWCYGRMPLDELASAAARMGLRSVEIIGPEDFDTIRKYGLECAMVNSHPLNIGLASKDDHERCLNDIRGAIEATADAGFPNVITFSGNRRGIPDDVGLENSVLALKEVVGLAEKKGVTICMELLNSRVDHKDYMCDRTAWGVELVERVGSERFKLLYDIYHMQIMEGDVIRTIRDHHDKIGHYHTAGNPGRNELSENQELNYPAIVRAIIDTGYDGYLGQEFIPKEMDPLEALAHGVRICDV